MFIISNFINKKLLKYLLVVVLSLCIANIARADEYSDAVKNAQLNSEATTRTWIAPNLQTISGVGDGNTYVNVGGQDRVLVRSFVKQKNTSSYTAGQDINIYGNPLTNAAWVTVGNSLRNYWAANNINYSNVQPETARALGMNTNVINDTVIEYLVNPTNDNIQRPTKNPDITSYNSNTAPLPSDNFIRPAGITDQKYNDFKIYYENWKKGAYGKDQFPWTQYGYTYRWGYGDNLNDIDGLTEFIMLGGTPARVYGIYSIQSYLYTTGNGSGDFNVNNNVDTIWAGRRFQPKGNIINISQNATVSGGQGILVSSPGYTINNNGFILGPTQVKYNNNNTENIAILFQGILPTNPNVDPVPNNFNIVNNMGSISSPGIAIKADAGNTIINNYRGLISGEDDAIRIVTGNSNINNNAGTIQGGQNGIVIETGNSIINNNRGYIAGESYSILTGTGNDQLNNINGLLQGRINMGDGNDVININPGLIPANPSEIIFNLSSTTPVIQNVEMINVNDNLRLSPINNQFVANNQIYPFAPNANIVIAPGKTIYVAPVIPMPMVTFNLDATNTNIISHRDLSWYTKNAYNSSLGQTLDNIAAQGGGILTNELYLLDSSANPGAISSQLEPVNQTGSYTSTFYSNLAFVDAFRDRLRRLSVEQNVPALPQPNVTGFASSPQLNYDQRIGRIEAFANGYGYKEWFKSTGNTPGYESLGGGFISGVGGRFGKRSYAGLIFGISNNNVDYTNKIATLGNTTYRVGPYASLHLGPIDFDALVTYGYHSLNSQRSISYLYSQANSDFSMNDFMGYFGLSKAIHLKRGFHIIPQASLQYSFLNRSGYAEMGANNLNLTVNSNNYNSLLIRPGLTVMKDFKIKNLIIRPEITAEWIGECLDPRKNIVSSFTNVSNSQFVTTPGEVDFNSARIGGGFSLFSTKKTPLSFFIRNDTIVGKRGVVNAITAGLRLAI